MIVWEHINVLCIIMLGRTLFEFKGVISFNSRCIIQQTLMLNVDITLPLLRHAGNYFLVSLNSFCNYNDEVTLTVPKVLSLL